MSKLACLLVPVALVACADDHDRLAKTASSTSTTGVGGAGGAVATGGSSKVGGFGGGGPVEPDGPTKLTVVNGIVDDVAVRFCFVPYPDGATDEVLWPASEAGLAFAQAATIDLSGDVLPKLTDFELVIVAGDLGETAGMDCAEIIDAPPMFARVASLGVVPTAVIDEQKSLVLVPSGCLGGKSYTHDLEQLACGSAYTPDDPTATLLAGFLSRLDSPTAFAMQFMHASPGMGETQVTVKPGENKASVAMASDWTIGAIAPFPPSLVLDDVDLASLQTATVEISAGGSMPIHITTFAQAFANGGLADDYLANGRGAAFIAVGANPQTGAGPWWHTMTVTAVASDP